MSDMSRADDGATARVASGDEGATTGAAWGAVLSLSIGVFALVTAEFLPASLLTPMASDLHISYGAAGQAVTATALVAAVAAPAVVIGTAKIDRRMVVWGLSLLLVLSDLLAAAASSLWVLLLARVVLGVALGGTWSLAAALAIRLVPARLVARAMSIIFTGVTAASVCAPALGAYLGDLWGWRATFLAASAIGIAALAVQLATMPRLPSTDGPSLRTFFLLLHRPRIRTGLITVMFVISGHFAGFTYVRPFLEQVSRLDVRTLSMVLLAFGAGGFFGNFAGGMMSGRSPRMSVVVGALLLAATAFGLLAGGTSTGVAFVALAVWGFAFGVLPVSIQTWTTQAALDHAESAGALLVTTFQIAIATGAILGGVLVDHLGAPGVIGYCGVVLLVGAATMLGLGRGGVSARSAAGEEGLPVSS